MMPIVGFLPADDPRMLATIDAIAERLTDERGLVYRYDTGGGADGLEGREGTFVLCTFWLAQALALAGQPARARHVFERAISYLNDVGLLAEEVDPATGELLGNFPQAFSHIGLINAAWAISQAERRQAAATGSLPAMPRFRGPETVPARPAVYAVASDTIALHAAGGGREAAQALSGTLRIGAADQLKGNSGWLQLAPQVRLSQMTAPADRNLPRNIDRRR